MTEKVRRRPYAVVLMDEIEKAHPDVLNVLLQILEEGRLTDGLGRSVDFRNTILIMTTNAGAEAIKNESAFGFQRPGDDAGYGDMKRRVTDEIERHFRPEFINRFNDVIVFRHLNKADLEAIVDMELTKLRKRLVEKALCLTLSDDAKSFLIKKGSNLDYGARPLRRAIESNLEDSLSENILRGTFDDCNAIVVGVEGEGEEERLTFVPKKFEEMTEEELEAPEIKTYRRERAPETFAESPADAAAVEEPKADAEEKTEKADDAQ